MSTYQELLNSIKDGKQLFDIRLQLIQQIENHTSRKLIIAAADDRKQLSSIESEDIVGFADLIKGIEGHPLDILINSPGGSAEAVEQIVNFLRTNFSDIRFIIPYVAMSAATLMCLAGNEILMDDRSSLGPIDPQVRIPTPSGPNWFPAQMIIDGYKKAREEIQRDQRALSIFLPWLTYFGPYVEICQNALKLSEELATKWLKAYMFADNAQGRRNTKKIVKYLLNHKLHKSHGRRIKIDDAVKIGLRIRNLRDDAYLCDLTWKLWCALYFLFDKSNKAKIFENAYGVNWGRDVVIQPLAVQLPSAPGFPMPPQVPPQQPPSSSRLQPR